jgi:hypothetical protein
MEVEGGKKMEQKERDQEWDEFLGFLCGLRGSA